MHILFGHGTPRGISRELQGHIVKEARAQGYDTLSDGDLLKAAEEGLVCSQCICALGQLGSKTRPFHGSFGCLIAIRATEAMGLRVRSSTHNPKVVSSN